MNLKTLISGASVATLALTGAASASSFSDVAGHWVETGLFLDTAIEKGIINGDKTFFNPNESINRAALTKMVAVYDNGGTLPTSVDYLQNAGFSDVASDAWYYDVVNYAAEEGIIDGSKSEFFPARAVNRAEAVKVITLALEVPSVDVTLPFTDVASDAWFAPYVRNAYGNCIVSGTTDTTFSPAAPITRAAAVKVFVASITPGCESIAPTPTVDPTETPEVSSSTTPAPVVTTDATVEVVISQNSPAAQSVPQNAYQVPFLALDITASNDEDLLLTGLTVQHTGLGDADEVKNLQVFDGVIPRGNNKNFSGEDDIATLNLQGDVIVIAAGTTKTIYVKADIQATSETAGEHAIALLNSDSVVLIGKTSGAVVLTTGTFPLVGATMNIANIAVGSVEITASSIADNQIDSGETDIEIARYKVQTGAAEDVLIQAITLDAQGLLDDGNVQNIYAEFDGDRVSNIASQFVNDKVTLDLTDVIAEGVLIKDSSTKYISIKADFTGAIDSFGANTGSDNDFAVTIEDSSDFIVTGAKYGFGVARSFNDATNWISSTNLAFIDIQGGDITFTLDSTSTDVADNTDEIVFGKLTIENKAEAIEIDKNSYKFTLNSTCVNPTSTTCTPGNDLENIKLVNATTGATVLGTVDAIDTATGTSVVTLGTNFTEDLFIPASTTVSYYIVADTVDPTNTNTVEEGTTYEFVISSVAGTGLHNLTITGQTSDEVNVFTVKPESTLSTKKYTLQEAGLVVTNKTLSSDKYVASTKGAVVWNGTVRAKNVKDIELTRFEFNENGTAVSADINSLSLQALIEDVWVTVEGSVSLGTQSGTTEPFAFTSLDGTAEGKIVIKKGDEVEFRVVADIADDVTTADKIKISLDKIETKQIEVDGTTGDTVIVDVVDADYTAVEFELANNGTIALSLDTADSPNTAELIAGSSDQIVSVYKVKAEDENVSINDVTVSVVDASVTVITPYQATPPSPATLAAVTLTVDATDNVVAGDVLTLKVFDSTPTIKGTYNYTVTTTDSTNSAVNALTSVVNADPALTAVYNGSTVVITDADATDNLGLDANDTVSYATTRPLNPATLTGSTAATTPAVSEIVTITLLPSTPAVGTKYVVSIDGNEYSSTIGDQNVADAKDAANAIATAIANATSNTATNNNSATITITGATPTTNPATSLIISAYRTTASGSVNAKDAVKSVSLYSNSEELDTVTLNSDGKAVFEDINFTVEAGITTDLVVKVNLNNIGTNSSDTAKSGHTFSTELTLVEAKGTESGEVLDPNGVGIGDDTVAASSTFLVTNNKLQVAKLDQSTTLAGGVADLLKFKLFDASTDGDRAEVKKITFNLTGNTGVDLATGLYELVGGNQVITCIGTFPSTPATTATVTCDFSSITEEISAAGTTFVLKATGISVTPDDTVTTKLVVNSSAVGADGVEWLDGGDGSATTANGVPVQWIDFGESDESTTYILNVVSN